MSKRDPSVSLLGRYRVQVGDHHLRQFVQTEQVVRLRPRRGPAVEYIRHTLRGVPGRHADAIIARSLMPGEAVLDVADYTSPVCGPGFQDCVLELGQKAGRYDGAKRRRYALRRFPRHDLEALPRAELRIIAQPAEGDEPGRMTLIVRPWADDQAPIVDEWPMLRTDLCDYELWRVWAWQYARYYSFIGLTTRATDEAPSEVYTHAQSWAALNAEAAASDWTLAEANQSASRDLYRLARELGWRKLTRREKDRLGIDQDAPQWWRQDRLVELYAAWEHHSATGCGKSSLVAASDGHWPAADAPLTELEALELEFDDGYSMRADRR